MNYNEKSRRRLVGEVMDNAALQYSRSGSASDSADWTGRQAGPHCVSRSVSRTRDETISWRSGEPQTLQDNITGIHCSAVFLHDRDSRRHRLHEVTNRRRVSDFPQTATSQVRCRMTNFPRVSPHEGRERGARTRWMMDRRRQTTTSVGDANSRTGRDVDSIITSAIRNRIHPSWCERRSALAPLPARPTVSSSFTPSLATAALTCAPPIRRKRNHSAYAPRVDYAWCP